LGCSGFIISDENGYFVSRKTKAYLQYCGKAFNHVEEILQKNFGIVPSPHEVITEGGKEEEDLLSNTWTMPSVGIESMDEEHARCESVLSLLLAKPNLQPLTKAMEALTEHFQHEEELMKQTGFGKPHAPSLPTQIT
jgi:hypothetical protein